MQKKKLIVMCSLLVAIVLLGIGTIAYFRRTVNGDITGQTGNLVLIVNEADAVANESFEVILQRSEEENFIMPDDKGVFNLNIDSVGSSDNVAVTITISRTNLPNNLKFYSDVDYTEELTTKSYVIEKSAVMTMTVPVYWFWDGSVSDEDDSEFINTTISANISVTATIAKKFYDTLLAMNYTLDTNVDFMFGTNKIDINNETCMEEYQYYIENCPGGTGCTEYEQQCIEPNGEGLMMRDGTQNTEYPIMYYRGDVANNNVVYAGYCWLIVRTTETGGVKLIYNGEVNDDGSCNNYSDVTSVTTYNENYEGAYIESSAFNINDDSPVYVGYMYNDTNKYYTCTDDRGTWCAAGELDGTGYKSHLEDNTVASETGRHIQNLKDSTIKIVIDEWYARNIDVKSEARRLEDTVWCNDRSIVSTTYSPENYANNRQFMFGAGTRLIESPEISGISSPTLVCNREMDKFTVNSAKGNRDLDYPVGLLTADEMVLAGNSFVNLTNTFLSIPAHRYWSLSPFLFGMSGSAATIIASGSTLDIDAPPINTSTVGVRPSVSLDDLTYITGGNGSFVSPYRVGFSVK